VSFESKKQVFLQSERCRALGFWVLYVMSMLEFARWKGPIRLGKRQHIGTSVVLEVPKRLVQPR
jgi:hypothetical protein